MYLRYLRTIGFSFGLAALAIAAMWGFYGNEPASATIHEIVASHCSRDHRGNLDPPGQTPTSLEFDQSDFRALLATGVYDENTIQMEGVDPATGLPIVRVVPADLDHPASKFSWDGETFVGPFPVDIDGDGEADFLALFPELIPDHPSLAHCHNIAG